MARVEGLEGDALVALARVLAPLVADELAQRDVAQVYSSAGPLPRGWSRRRFLEFVRDLPTATRTGGKRGRGVVWSISRADFEAALDRRMPSVKKAEPQASDGLDALISNAGYRPTKSR